MGYDQAAALWVLAGVGGFGEGGEGRVPGFEEGVAALFDPAVEVGGGDGVGSGEERVAGVEELDGSGVVDDALGAAQGERDGSGEVIALVLDDEGSAAAHEVVEAWLGGGESG